MENIYEASFFDNIINREYVIIISCDSIEWFCRDQWDCYDPKKEIGVVLTIRPSNPDIDGTFMNIYGIPIEQKDRYIEELVQWASSYNKNEINLYSVCRSVPTFDNIKITDNSG